MRLMGRLKRYSSARSCCIDVFVNSYVTGASALSCSASTTKRYKVNVMMLEAFGVLPGLFVLGNCSSLALTTRRFSSYFPVPPVLCKR